jgi:hypothetical protein
LFLLSKHLEKPTGQSRMEQDTELRQTKHKNKQTKQTTHTTRTLPKTTRTLPKTEGLP